MLEEKLDLFDLLDDGFTFGFSSEESCILDELVSSAAQEESDVEVGISRLDMTLESLNELNDPYNEENQVGYYNCEEEKILSFRCHVEVSTRIEI